MSLFLEIGVFLVLVLGVLLAILFIGAKKRKALEKQKKKTKVIDLATLVKRIKAKTATETELKENLELVLKLYGTIDDFAVYEDILFTITLHPNTNKNLILHFDKELSQHNPEYKKRISDAVMGALKAR